ncbi:hypothetical protein ACFL7M_00325 [Thermodesulfobacteriota bacterium]
MEVQIGLLEQSLFYLLTFGSIMVRNKNISGAPASNAGDEFHELWALQEILHLLDPSTLLSGMQLEGVQTETSKDAEGPQWDGVDCTLYYGGRPIKSANRIEIVQLKYSVAKPEQNWTMSRFCKNKAKSENNSVARRLGQAFQKIISLRGSEGIESLLSLKFVSNQPIQPKLQNLVKSLTEGNALDDYAEKLYKATCLKQKEFYLFIRCLELKGGGNARRALKKDIIHAVSSLIEDSAKIQVAQ